MKLIDCEEDVHSDRILDIFNHEILNSTSLFDYKLRSREVMKTWFENKRKGRYPVIGAVDDNGYLMGFVSYGPFRAWPAYKYTVEHSVYVDKSFRGNGIGRKLMIEIIEAARRQEYHVMVAGIESSNSNSIKLHEKMNFKHCGKIEHAGYKFGRWLDLSFMQLTLKTPLNPKDG